MTDLVDFLEPRGGRVGGFSPSEDRFSLSSSRSLATAGDAGIVLNRFFSVAAAVRDARVDEVGRVSLAAGVAGVAVLRMDVGLVTDALVVAVGRAVVRLAGVPTTLLVVEEGTRSVLGVGAIDIRLGLAEIPSFLSSALSSPTEVVEGLLRCTEVAVEGVVVVVLRTVLGTVERTGGLLSDELVLARVLDIGVVLEVVDEGVVRLAVVAVFGAVNGRRAAAAVGLGVAFSSFALSAMIIETK